MKADIDAGFDGNTLTLTLTPESLKEYDIKNVRTVARHIEKYLSDNSLPYVVSIRTGNTVLVKNPKKTKK